GAIRADVAKEAEVEAMFAEMLAAWGRIDILVSNAGLQRDAALTEMTLEQWNTVLGVNLTGTFLCTRAAARAMIRQGVVAGVSKAAGKILCISSVHEVIPWAGHANYAASKGGMKLFMQTVAQELAPRGVRRPRHGGAPRVAVHQRPRRLRLGHARGHADAPLPRPPDRRAAAAAGPARGGDEARRERRVRRRHLRAGYQPLGQRLGRPARLPPSRALPSGRHHARVDVRVSRRAAREARLDGARGQHDVRALSDRTILGAAHALVARAGEPVRLPRDRAGRRLDDVGHADRRRAAYPGLRGRRARAAPGARD